MFFNQKFPCTQQLESKDCGPSCLQMLCKYYGHFYDLEYLRQICGIKKEGISVYDFIKASEKINFRSKAFKLSYWKFRNEVPLPCTVHWKNHHFVIVYKITKKYVFVSDPQDGLLKYSLKNFANGWLTQTELVGVKTKSRGVCIVSEPTDKFTSDKNSFRNNAGVVDSLKFLASYMKYYKSSIIKVFMLMFVITLLSVLFPIITQNIIDVGIPTKDYDFITIMLIASLFLTFSSSLSSWIKQLITTHFAVRIKLSMQSDFILKMFNLPLSFFENRLMGDLIQRNADFDRLESFIMGTCFNVVLGISQMLILGVVLIYFNTFIFWIFLLFNGLYVGWVLFFWSIRKKMDIRYFTYIARNQSEWIEMLSNMTDIKSYNYGSFKRWQWEKIQIKLFKTRIKLLNIDQIQTMGSTLINSIKDLILIYISANAVIHGEMSIGMLIAVQYILGQLTAPMESLIQFIVSVQLTNISFQRVQEIMSQPAENEINEKIQQTALIDYDKNIILQNVFFKYSVNDDFVLRNINCIIPKGKMTAIVGMSGCGKSTLLKLLIGLYKPAIGHIKIGCTELSSIPADEWRNKIGILTQESALFNESILDNIVFGREYDSDRILKVTSIANIKEDIESKPMGFNTYIQENGKGVSEGQKQRILLSRAMYGIPQYLFLDELTSSLDSTNELSIIESLKNMEDKPTTIIIAHRLSTVKRADVVLVVKDGQVVEEGTHQLLFKKRGFYYNLFKDQENVLQSHIEKNN